MTETQTDTLTEIPDTYAPELIKQLTHGILGRAVSLGASSVLIEPVEAVEPGDQGLQVSFENSSGRHLTPPLPEQITAPLLTALKTLAGINADSAAGMQTGRFRLRINGRLIRFEIVSLMLRDKEVMGITLNEIQQAAPTSTSPSPRRTGILNQARQWFKPEKKN